MHRLSGQDAYFLYQETPAALMHTLKILVCRAPAQPVDPARFREMVLRSMAAVPLFQYRVVPVPFGLHHPVVLNDGGFDFDRHVRRVTAPAPGEQEQLEQLIGEIAAGQLDRARPLWEIWIVEGLAGGRVAYVNKMHHLLADGLAAVNYLAQVLYREPAGLHEKPVPGYSREPQSAPLRLVLDALRDLVRDFARLPRLLAASGRARKAIEARNRDAAVAPPSPYSPEIPQLRFNRALSSERIYATAQFELEQLRALGRRIGGTINDALLATTAGALRRYLLRNDELPARALVCAVPVSADRETATVRAFGNNVAYFHVRLRTDIADPAERCRATLAEAVAAKEVLELFGRDTAREWMQYIPPPLFAWRRRRQYRTHAADQPGFPLSGNLILSNVPGPREPRCTAIGEPCEALYSAGPLTEGTGLNITFWSYAGKMSLGAIACRKAMPDLRALVEDFREELVQLSAMEDA